MSLAALVPSFLLQTGPPPASREASERFFEWGSLPPAWIVFLLVVPAVVAYVVFVYRREKPSGGRFSRSIPGALRALALLAVLAMLAKPLLREIVYQTRDPRFLLLVDDSLSMKIADKYADRSVPQRIADILKASPENVERTGRYDLVANLLRDRELKFLESLREKGRVAVWAFSGGLKKLADLARGGAASGGAPGTAEAASASNDVLPPYEKVQTEERVKQTRIGDALSEVVAGSRGNSKDDQDISCVILMSDGQQNSGALLPEDVARKLGQRGIPVYAVGVGNPEAPKDVRLVGIDSSDVVLVGDKVPFNASLVADGFEGERVRVDLIFNDEVVDSEYVTLEGRGERQSVKLEHAPRAPGDATVMVKVELSPGELLEENNIAVKAIKVLDQKIKVLYLEGPPRWEYRYLKSALIRDPTMEAQIYLYSADPGFIQESSPGVPALLRDPKAGRDTFPDTREELFQYHVVIIGDVDPDSFAQAETPQLMELLKEFVSEAGGGVVFISGVNANPARYLHTPLYQLLPVEVPEGGRGLDNDRSPTDKFNVELTGVGKEHPVMRLDSDPDRNRQLWENTDLIEAHHLPPFYWFAEVNREKSGAVKLSVHPRKGHPIYGPRVIHAFQNYGKGRTFFSAVDNTWRWRAGVDNYYFYKLWGQVIRFAASGRLLGKTQRFAITTDKQLYMIGDAINIDCRVYDANMKPATEEMLKVYHQVESGGAGGPRTLDPIVLPLNKVKGPGSYEGTITAEQLGRHELWLGSETQKDATRGFAVEVPVLESRDPRMDRARLQRIAELSGGKYYDFPEVLSLLRDVAAVTKPRQTPIDDRQEDLWDDTWVLFLVTGLLAAEWIYRKMVKLL